MSWTMNITSAGSDPLGTRGGLPIGYTPASRTVQQGWGLEQCRLTDGSLIIGQFTAVKARSRIEDAPICEFGATAELFDRNGRIRFVGKRIAAIGAARGSSESHSYRFANAWWDLQKRIYHQLWTTWRVVGVTAESFTSYTPHLILNANGRTVADEITDIINYAASQGVYIAAGTIEAPVIPKSSEVINRDCASIIAELMTYAPQNVCWFEYRSGAAPLFHCRPASALTAKTVDAFGVNGSEDLTIEARSEDVVTAVALRYERTDTFEVDGVTSEKRIVVTDIYPPSATGREERAVSETIQLAGLTSTEITADLLCGEFPGSNGSADFETAAAINGFWSQPIFNLPVTDSRLGGTAAANVEDRTTITAGSFLRTPAKSDEDDTPDLVILPRYIIAGDPADWMTTSAGDPITWQKQTLSALFNWTLFDSDAHATAGDIERVIQKRIPVYLTATDAPAGLTTYRKRTSFEEPETPPVGLAQYLYEKLSVLGYEGQRRHIRTECDGAVGLGHVLNLSGGASEWLTMNALVQSITEDIDTGTTTIGFGVAPTLSLGRILELLRNSRVRRRWTSVAERDTGEIGGGAGGAGIELGKGGADTNTVPGMEQLTMYAVKKDGQKVMLDARNRIIRIDASGVSSYFNAQVTDITSVATSAQDGSVYAQQFAAGSNAGHRAFGAGGSYDLTTSPLRGNFATWRLVRDCRAGDGSTVYARLIACTDRFVVTGAEATSIS